MISLVGLWSPSIHSDLPNLTLITLNQLWLAWTDSDLSPISSNQLWSARSDFDYLQSDSDHLGQAQIMLWSCSDHARSHSDHPWSQFDHAWSHSNHAWSGSDHALITLITLQSCSITLDQAMIRLSLDKSMNFKLPAHNDLRQAHKMSKNELGVGHYVLGVWNFELSKPEPSSPHLCHTLQLF